MLRLFLALLACATGFSASISAMVTLKSLVLPRRNTVSVLRVPGLVLPTMRGRSVDFSIALPSNLRDDVAGLDARLLGRRAALHAAHQRALGLAQADGLGHVLGHLVDLHADAAARHPPADAQLLADADGLVDRDGKGDAHDSRRSASRSGC